MTDDRPLPQDNELPAWLKGHIHPEPGQKPFTPQEPGAPSAEAAPAGAAPAEAGPVLPWGPDEGSSANLPSSDQLKGLTGQLPWLSDVTAGQTPADATASVPPAPEGGAIRPGLTPSEAEAEVDVFGWLAEEEQPGAPGGDKPGILTGLTGELPWLGDIAAPDAGAGQPGGAPSGEEDLAGAFDLDSAALDWQSVSEVPAPETPARPAIRRLQFDSAESTPAAGSEATQADWLPPEMENKPAEPVPDWLSAAEGFLDEAEAAPEAGTPAAPLPDWLSAQGSGEGEASDLEIGEPTPVPGEATPDWLSAADGLFDEEETPAEVEPLPAAGAGSTPDWLTGAADFAAETGEAEEEYLEAGPQARAEGGPEWLITETGEIGPEAVPEESGQTYEGWMAEQAEKEYQPTQEELLAAEVPDWFQTIEETPEAAETPAEAAPAPPGGSAEFVPDWFLGLEEQDTSAAPEWFDQKRISTDLLKSAPELPTQPPEPPAPVEAPVEPEAPADDEVPDWFAEMQAGTGAKSLEAPEPEPELPAAELPDWFGSIGVQEPAASSPAVKESPAAQELPPIELPDIDFGELVDLNEPEEAPAGPVSVEQAPAIPEAAVEIDFGAMDFGAPAEPAAQELAAQEPAAQGEEEDWLSGLEFEAEVPAPAAPEAAAEIDFGAMDFGAPAEPAAQELAAQEPAAEEEDWLSGLEFEAETPAPAEQVPAAEIDFGAMDFGAPAEPAAEAEEEDWLSGLEFEAETPAPAEQVPAEQVPAIPEAAAEIDFGAMDFGAPAEPAAEAEEEDWLSGLEFEAETPAPAEQVPAAEEEDWLSGLDFEAEAPAPAEQAPAEPVPAAPEAAASGGDLDWLAGIDLSEAAPATPTPVPGLEELSFEDLMAGTAAPAAPPPAAPPPAAGDVPDWFADFEEAAETPAVQPAGLAPGEMPDWLDAITPEGLAAAELKAAEEEISTGALQSGTPDFMKVIDQELGGQPAGAPLGPDAAVLTEKDATFDFEALLADQSAALGDLEEKPQPAGAPAETLLEGTGAEMPDWLMGARPDEAGGFSSVNLVLRRPETPVDELSERLRSLRERSAMAAALPAPEGEVIAGSGLAGGLPPAELEAKPGAPQVAHGLVIGDDQQAQVKKLERILGLDAAPAPQVDADGNPIAVDPVKEAARIRKEALHARAVSRRKPGRLVISLVLVAAVVLPFFLDVARLFNPPAAALNPDQQGTLDVSIEALRAGQRVLVGFEYGPTAAGEMDALAEPLLTHILLRGGRPVIVSSDSAGTLHARDVLDRLAHDEFLLAHLGRSPDDPLSMPRDYVILPYLSGGVVGLRALTAQNSRIFTVDLYGDPTRLRIDSLTRSFAFGLVLAERGEDIRLWAEQIGAATGLPLAAAVGVSAEPIARPYFDSGQLLGLLAGFRDAYIYDRVLLSSLPPVYPVNGAGEGDAQAAPPVEAEVTEQGGLAFLATPTPAGVAAQGLLTNTPAPTASPTPQVAATRTPRVTPTPEETTGAAAVDENASPTPRPFITATPVPVGGEAVALPGGSAAGAEALRPDRPYALERWYSLSLGALVAAVVIGLGAVGNIVRGFRRRRDQ